MTDIFQEVEEELSRDRLEAVWRRYGAYLIGAVALVFFVAVVIILWRQVEGRARAEASKAYFDAAQALDRGAYEEAANAFGVVSTLGITGYEALGRLREATSLRDAGKRQEAVAEFDALAADTSLPTLYRDLARLSAAMTIADQASAEDLRARLAPLLGQHPLRFFAHELLAFATYRMGDLSAARGHAQAVAEDPETPGGMRERAGKLLGLIEEQAPEDGAAPATQSPQANGS